MKRKFLAALLALVMVFSMIPVSASAAEVTGNKGIVKLDYNDSGAIDKTIKVVVQYNNQILDEYEVNNSRVADQKITLSLIGDYANTYDIESVSVDTPGAHSSTVHYLHKDSYECRLSLAGSKDTPATFTVTLCDPLETPDIEGGEIDPGINSIEYRAFDHDMLKLLYVNGVKEVDENTEINDVKMHFVESYQVDTHEQSLLNFKTAGNQVDYHYYTLSDVSDGKGIPGNIRYIEITYTLDGAEESKTLRVYSGDLRYVNKSEAGGNYRIYNIEAYNDNTSIVAFYYEAGAELTTWSLYDVRFVDTGTALGSENMPADPTYGDGNKYIFTNWDKNVKGGDPFLPYEEVLDDTVVYAQKTSSPGRGGTEIHVMNTDNELANRIMEIYNAENDTQLGSNSIDMDSVTIYATSKDGKTTTNHNYWNNGWRPLTGGNQYYRVINSDIAGDHPTISNDHIAHDNIGSITINATVNDTPFTVTLPVDETVPGAVSVSLVQDNIIEISVNGAPTAPTDDDLTGDTGLLGEGAVKVTCTNEAATHEPEEQTYGLLDCYTLSDVQWTGDGENGYYYVDITVPAEGYVTRFSTDSTTEHDLADGEADTDTIRLQYANEGWKVMENETPVTFEVTCTTDQPGGGDEPEAPDLSKVKISVACTYINHPTEVLNYKDYGLIDGSYTATMSGSDGTYTYSVTVSAEKYVSQFSEETGKDHRIDKDLSKDPLTIVYTYNGSGWDTTDRGNVFFVTCAEGGEEQPETPTITPEEVIALMGDNAIEVACQTVNSGHNPSSYSLILGSFTVGSVTPDENGQYSCEITIDENGILQYVDAYDKAVGSEHTAIYYGPITFTITHDGTKWLKPSQLPAATITVVCEADQEDELDEDDLNEILGGAITVQCVSEEDHGYKTLTLYELLENASLGDASLENIYSFIKNADGTYTVTLDGEKFASAYGTYVSDKIGKGENIPHQLVNEENADFKIRLTYDGIKWTFDPDPIVIEVTCEDDSGDEPVEPTPTPTPDPTPTPTPTPDPGYSGSVVKTKI